MRNFKSNERLLTISSLSALLAITLTNFAGCFKASNQNSSYINSSTSSTSDISDSTTSISETTDETEVYTFMWDDIMTKQFDDYCAKNLKKNLVAYVRCFGFTEELNILFTRFVNSYYKSNYKSVPFSKANYFYSYIYQDKEHYRYRDYETFSIRFFNSEKILWGTYNNKLIMSYLVANNIEFGSTIPINNFKLIYGEKIITDTSKLFDMCLMTKNLGNNSSTQNISAEELTAAMLAYNNDNNYLYDDERIKTRNFKDCPDSEAIVIYNQHLKKFYGENAPQIGEVFTPEKYKALFGEDPLDLSNIPGAIVATSQQQMSSEEKTNDSIYSPVIPLVDQQTGQFYGYIDYPNKNVHYFQQDQSEEEQSGRTR